MDVRFFFLNRWIILIGRRACFRKGRCFCREDSIRGLNLFRKGIDVGMIVGLRMFGLGLDSFRSFWIR